MGFLRGEGLGARWEIDVVVGLWEGARLCWGVAGDRGGSRGG